MEKPKDFFTAEVLKNKIFSTKLIIKKALLGKRVRLFLCYSWIFICSIFAVFCAFAFSAQAASVSFNCERAGTITSWSPVCSTAIAGATTALATDQITSERDKSGGIFYIARGYFKCDISNVPDYQTANIDHVNILFPGTFSSGGQSDYFSLYRATDWGTFTTADFNNSTAFHGSINSFSTYQTGDRTFTIASSTFLPDYNASQDHFVYYALRYDGEVAGQCYDIVQNYWGTTNQPQMTVEYTPSGPPTPPLATTSPEWSNTQFWSLAGEYFIPQNINCARAADFCHMVFGYTFPVFSRSISSSTNADLVSYPRFSWYWPNTLATPIESSTIRHFIDSGQQQYVDFTFPVPTSSAQYILRISDPHYTEASSYDFVVNVNLFGSVQQFSTYCALPCDSISTSTNPLDLNNFVCGLHKFGCWLTKVDQNVFLDIASQWSTLLHRFPLAPITKLSDDFKLIATGTQAVLPGHVSVPRWSSSTQSYSSVVYNLAATSTMQSYGMVKWRRLERMAIWVLAALAVGGILIVIIL